MKHYYLVIPEKNSRRLIHVGSEKSLALLALQYASRATQLYESIERIPSGLRDELPAGDFLADISHEKRRE
jgi:hypothetical protein